jgi:hypothetical protein
MYTTVFRIPIKKPNLGSQVRLTQRLERISFKQGTNKHLKVFGKITIFKMKTLMTFRRQMLLHLMVMSLLSNIKDSRQLKIKII